MNRIYLDNAATSWPKPESVYRAVDYAQREIGAAAGRGNYKNVVEALRLIENTRGKLAKLINASDKKSISFCLNGTDALSTAIFGLLKPTDHVITTVVEHNSVLRPIKHLESIGRIKVDYIGCDEHGRFSVDDIIQALRIETKLVACLHVSNVTGTVQPIDELKARLNKDRLSNENIFLLIDAAQSLGSLPVDVQSLGCDILCAPGHKGLLGPLGTGVLYVDDKIANEIEPLRYGGTGTDGSIEFQPTETPDKFESGNINLPGIAGLEAGIDFLTSEEGLAAAERYKELSQLMLDGLLSIGGLSLQGNSTMENRIGLFSVSIDNLDCRDAAGILDSTWSIQTRAGLHCAPMLHRALGTEEQGGTLRFSLGLFNTKEQIEKTIDAMRQLTKSVNG